METLFDLINTVAKSDLPLRTKKDLINKYVRMCSDFKSVKDGVEPRHNSGQMYLESALVSEQAEIENKFHIRGKDRSVTNEHPIPANLFVSRIINDKGISWDNFNKMLLLLTLCVITKKEDEALSKAGLNRKMPYEIEDVYSITDVYARYNEVGIKPKRRKDVA